MQVHNKSLVDTALRLAEFTARRLALQLKEYNMQVAKHSPGVGIRPDAPLPKPEAAQPIAILSVSFDNKLKPPGGLVSIHSSATKRNLTMSEDLYYRTSLPLCFEDARRAQQPKEEESMFVSASDETDETESWDATQCDRSQSRRLNPGDVRYIPQVVVTRQGKDHHYAALSPSASRDLPVFSVITAPSSHQAYSQTSSDSTSQTREDVQAEQAFSDKCVSNCMRHVLSTAVRNGHRSVVLSTMGLGETDGRKPIAVARLWLQALKSNGEFQKSLHNVWFAVSDHFNGPGQHDEFRFVVEF